MGLVSQHIVGSESFFSNTKGVGGKLRKKYDDFEVEEVVSICLLYTSPSPRD